MIDGTRLDNQRPQTTLVTSGLRGQLGIVCFLVSLNELLGLREHILQYSEETRKGVAFC